MCIKASTTHNNDPLRRSANYQRNIWVPQFIESLQSEVKDMLIDDTVGCLTKLELIDDLERLGVGYHFEKEVKSILAILFINSDACVKDDLHSTALYFRLLRQCGYKVSQGNVINQINMSGNLRLGLCEEVKEMLSLYEASHLGLRGENILHEAKYRTVKHLKLLINENKDSSLAEEVNHALELPLHWRMPRLEAKYYIHAYQREEKMNPILFELAMLDFNMLQSTYQHELRNLSSWWKHLGLSDKLSFARDRLVESFLGSVGVAYKPQYQCCREWITKSVCLIIAIDDIYDIYGSLHELELFTAAVERWEIEAMEGLPDYMKICFLALFNTTNDIVYMKYKEDGVDILLYVKKAWADFCKAMLLEAKWSKMGYMPSLNEYLENAWVSSSTTIGLVLAFFGTGQPVTHEALISLNNNPDLIYYSAMILRLCNDLATSSAELERGDVPSAIQCQMHEGYISQEVARENIGDLISEMWKKLNESIYDSPFEDSFINIVVNNARTAHSIYQHGDGIGVQDHEAKKRVTELLVEPLSI
ncbi:hypothetical protein AQUCO_00500401v1 [Aquilegia coerulea]|uniref:Uncharacterized protein n=1 Tax=Aquilegia coerulea TaxID=218851 RepID=A0A2G5ERS2_AQUCA|nr:hypothetical protein AQUCO_00500401v1 [Aquilegia coerulea]